MSSPSEQSVGELAKSVMDKYNVGPRMIKLEDLGIHEAQRRLNIPHCHTMIKDIMDREGFSRVVYKSLLVIEPDPNNLLDTYNYTKKKYEAVSGTPSIGLPREMYAVVDGQHLSTALKCLAAGNVPFYNDSNKVLQLPPQSSKTQELYDHIKNGFHCQVISYKAWLECPDGVRALCRLENNEAVRALSDPICNVFEVVSHAARTSSGSADDIPRAMDSLRRTLSTRFANDDLIKLYTLGKVVSENDVSVLVNFSNRYVHNMELRPDLFKSLSELAISAPKLKIACIMANLKSDTSDGKNAFKSATGWVGNTIKCKDLKKFVEPAMEEHLINAEEALAKLQDCYSCEKLTFTISAESFNKSVVELMIRFAKITFLSSWRDAKSTEAAYDRFSLAEDKFRESLATAGAVAVSELPQRYLKISSKSEDKKEKKTPSTDSVGQLESCPALKFSDGKVVVDEVSKAYAARIFVGCKVHLDKLPNKDRAVGVVDCIDPEGIKVKWDKPDLAEDRKYFASELHLLVTTLIVPKLEKKRKFSFIDDDAFTKLLLLDRVTATLNCLYSITCSRSAEYVEIAPDGKFLRCKKEAPAHSIVFSPPVSAVVDVVPAKKPYVEVITNVGHGKLAKTKTFYAIVEYKSSKARDEPPKATAPPAEEGPKFINPFLTVARTTKENSGTLGVFSYKVSDGQLKSVSRKFNVVGDSNGEYTLSVPMFTNSRLMYDDQILSVASKDSASTVRNLDKTKTQDDVGEDVD